MAITKAENQVQWDTGNNSDTVTAGGNTTSDNITLDDSCYAADIHMKATYTSGAPAADDIIHFWLLRSGGDPDGASTAEFDTPPQAAGESGGALHLGAVDLNKGETDGSGKKLLKTVALPVDWETGQLYAEGLTEGTTNTITVSATITEHRSA